jgi:hypothetical protein
MSETENGRYYFRPDAPAKEAWSRDPEGATLRLDSHLMHDVRAESVLYEQIDGRWQPLADGGRDLEPFQRGLVCRTWKSAIAGSPAWGFECVRPLDAVVAAEVFKGAIPRDENGLALTGTPGVFYLLENDAATFVTRFQAHDGRVVRPESRSREVHQALEQMAASVEALRGLRELDRRDLERARGGDFGAAVQFDARTSQLLEHLGKLRTTGEQLTTATASELGQEKSKEERKLALDQRDKSAEHLEWAQGEYELRAKERLELAALEDASGVSRMERKRGRAADRQFAADLTRIARKSGLEVSEDDGVVCLVVGAETFVFANGRLSVGAE